MTLVLYHSAYSTCSQKVRLVLAEKGLPFESREVDFGTNEHLMPEYLRLNPNGVVPTLVHDGEPVTDSSCIMEYLDEVFPEPAMSPPSAMGRARMRSLLRYFEEVPTVAVRYPSFQKVFLPLISQYASAETFEAGAEMRPLRAGFYRKMNSGKGFGDAEMAESQRQLRQVVERMDAALDDGPWLLGEQFTLADCCLIPSADRLDDLGMASLWRDRPRFARWLKAVRERPSFSQAYYAGSRLSERPEFAALIGSAREASE